eukprot:CAMPEP_0204610934 /NCGR_PEP_ID=MMETSP0661-20131031/61761_1 /ASSEMBLY_ACC=CAM_ASM_000606 /TAXON_ID=109239 /ORGANISM="Alexandrium margalefi, Strain AMGDE01CS-322" /LENGTH=93 /DNA_ID=CAMNT_0051622761 /DNA_START=526 /DNA_END=803 /DNA_ORIENTATION=-
MTAAATCCNRAWPHADPQSMGLKSSAKSTTKSVCHILLLSGKPSGPQHRDVAVDAAPNRPHLDGAVSADAAAAAVALRLLLHCVLAWRGGTCE